MFHFQPTKIYHISPPLAFHGIIVFSFRSLSIQQWPYHDPHIGSDMATAYYLVTRSNMVEIFSSYTWYSINLPKC